MMSAEKQNILKKGLKTRLEQWQYQWACKMERGKYHGLLPIQKEL